MALDLVRQHQSVQEVIDTAHHHRPRPTFEFKPNQTVTVTSVPEYLCTHTPTDCGNFSSIHSYCAESSIESNCSAPLTFVNGWTPLVVKTLTSDTFGRDSPYERHLWAVTALTSDTFGRDNPYERHLWAVTALTSDTFSRDNPYERHLWS